MTRPEHRTSREEPEVRESRLYRQKNRRLYRRLNRIINHLNKKHPHLDSGEKISIASDPELSSYPYHYDPDLLYVSDHESVTHSDNEEDTDLLFGCPYSDDTDANQFR